MSKRETLVEVTWDDAVSWDAWQHRVDAETDCHSTPTLCVSVGHLLKRDKRAITLATTVGGGAGAAQVAGVWRIPAGMVKRVRRIR